MIPSNAEQDASLTTSPLTRLVAVLVCWLVPAVLWAPVTAGAHDVPGDPTDQLGILTGFDRLRQHTLGADTIEVWVCQLSASGSAVDAEVVAADLNEFLPGYMDWLSGGAKQLSFVAGGLVMLAGSTPDPAACLDAVEPVAAADAVASNGALLVFNVNYEELAGTPGDGSAFPANGRFGVVGANEVKFISTLDRAALAQVVGHTMEFPHSLTGMLTDQFGNPVPDNEMDVMSRSTDMVGTPALNRYGAGWIEPSQVRVYAEAAIDVDVGPLGYLGSQLIVIPGPEPHTYAAIDVRVKSGFDANLPAEGVTVHFVDERSSVCGFEPHCSGIDRLVTPADAFPFGEQHVHGVGDTFSVYGIEVGVLDRLGGVFTVAVGDVPFGFPPDAQLQLNALTETAVTLSWPSALGAEDYEVSGAMGTSVVTAPSITLNGLAPGTVYDLGVVGRKGAERTAPLTLQVKTLAAGGSRIGLQNPAAGFWSLVENDAGLNGFYYGTPGDLAMACDWNGDGIDTVGLYRPTDGFLYLRNSNNQGPGEIEIFYGEPADIPVCGDWNGDGVETPGVYRPRNATFYLRNSNTQGFADIEFIFGNPGDVPFAGDWDGDGVDTVGLYRQTTGFVYITNENKFGVAEFEAFYGNPGDRFVVGDWDGNGLDSFGIFRPSDQTFYLSNIVGQAIADIQIVAGDQNTVPVAGVWD